MTELFLDVLNASYAASFVVLAVILARLLLRKAPRWMVCALWALVAVRLLVPGIFETSFSLVPSREIIPPQSLYDAAPQIQSGFASIDNAVNPVYTESLRPMPGASVNPLQVWLAVFANVWLLGALGMGIWALASCIRVRRRLRERVRAEGNIFLCDGIESPFIFGLFRPMICLPSTLGEEARRHVIAHEKAHLRRRDHWWKPLGFLLLTVNWFNPLMWVAYVLLCRDIEMACDERVIRELGPKEKKAYSTALLACSINPRHITACPLAFGEVGVKQRVRSVLNYKKPAFGVILLTLAVTIALAAGLLTDPTVPHQSQPESTSAPSETEEPYLGISLRAEDATSRGLRLIYDHEGGSEEWKEIVSAPAWTLERFENNAWVNVLTADIAWPEVMVQVPINGTCSWNIEFQNICGNLSEGLYRIGKTFYGHPDPDDIKATTHATEQTCYAEFLVNPLGLTGRLENVTPSGATLIVEQDGTLWDQIITGSYWMLEKQVDGEWVSVMPESTPWTTVSYIQEPGTTWSFNLNWNLIVGTLEPGHYRAGKRFTGERSPMFTLELPTESQDQMVWVEFTIE